MLPVFLNFLRIELVQRLQRKLEVGEQCVATRLGEILAHDDTQHLHLLRMRRHRVGGDDPSTFAELMSTAHISRLLAENFEQTHMANSS